MHDVGFLKTYIQVAKCSFLIFRNLKQKFLLLIVQILINHSLSDLTSYSDENDKSDHV